MLNVLQQRYVGEIPVNFWASRSQSSAKQKVSELLLTTSRRGWKRLRIDHDSGDISLWSYRSMVVFAAGRRQRLVVAVKLKTNEVKYFLSNAVNESAKTVLRVGLRRGPVEHLFRIAKQEVGLMHFEGQSYRGLMRHPCLPLPAGRQGQAGDPGNGDVGIRVAAYGEVTKKNPRLTMEQVAKALNARSSEWLRRQRGTTPSEYILNVICYHQRRNAIAIQSRRRRALIELRL